MKLNPVHGSLVRPVSVAPTALNVSPGTLSAGTVADLAAYGGTTVDVLEDTGSPGFIVEVVFTGVTAAREFVYSGHYEGSSSHVVYLEVYNYTTSNWDIVRRIDTMTSMLAGSVHVGPSAYVSGGSAKIRFIHDTNGVGTHHMYLDFVGLFET